MEHIAFLGHVISKEDLAVDPSKVEVAVNWKNPKNVAKIRSFIGLAGYYRRFVEGFYKISALLTKVSRKNVRFVWTPECEANF